MTSCTCCLNFFPKECAEGVMTSLCCYALQFFFFPPGLELVLPECKKKNLQSTVTLDKSQKRGKQGQQNRKTTFCELEGYRTFQSGVLTHFLGQGTAVNVYLCSESIFITQITGSFSGQLACEKENFPYIGHCVRGHSTNPVETQAQVYLVMHVEQ